MSNYKEIKIIRSSRRRRTSSAKIVNNTLEIRVPDHLSEDEIQEIAESLKKKVDNKIALAQCEIDLEERAAMLNEKYLEGKAHWSSIDWSQAQKKRWGTCVLPPRRIWINDSLRNVPDYVLNQVIIHELVHTFIRGNHSEEFYEWARKAPDYDKAEGYLEAYARWGVHS